MTTICWVPALWQSQCWWLFKHVISNPTSSGQGSCCPNHEEAEGQNDSVSCTGRTVSSRTETQASFIHVLIQNHLPWARYCMYLVLGNPRWIRHSICPLEVRFYLSFLGTFKKKRGQSYFTVLDVGLAISSEELKCFVPKRVEWPLGRISWDGCSSVLSHYNKI